MSLFEPTSFVRTTDAASEWAASVRSRGVIEDAADDTVNVWNPGIQSPSVFTNSRLGLRVVPRVPIRLQTSMGQGGEQSPEKIDPRAVRFTEIVESILNGLITSGGIYKTNEGWSVSYIVRQITDAEASVGEDFFSTNRNKRCYKDADGVVHDLY